jgi:hypothetical protein
MGRYYYGDIEGKFWFAVQPSDAADRFGVMGTCPNYIEYCFGKEDLPGVQKELANIENILGDKLAKLDEFFKGRTYYNDQDLQDFLGISKEQTEMALRHYADYELGKKIEACIIENGSCTFEGEL